MTEPWRVGALAKELGITVRTLHHYDAIGLVCPSRRSDAGYRLYTARDVARLSHVLMLRRLGLGLEEIQRVLGQPDRTLQRTLGEHIDRLRAQIDAQRALLSRLERLESQLTATAGAETPERLATLMEMTRMIEEHYTQEQLAGLEARRQQLGEEDMQRVQEEWTEVFNGFRDAMARGDAPDTPAVQALARRAAALIAMFTGGDPGVAASLQKMYAEEGGPAVLNQHGYGVDEALWAFMGEARAALDEA